MACISVTAGVRSGTRGTAAHMSAHGVYLCNRWGVQWALEGRLHTCRHMGCISVTAGVRSGTRQTAAHMSAHGVYLCNRWGVQWALDGRLHTCRHMACIGVTAGCAVLQLRLRTLRLVLVENGRQNLPENVPLFKASSSKSTLPASRVLARDSRNNPPKF